MSDPNIHQLLQAAIGHHQAGRFQQAESIYQQILARHPDQPDALHFLGVIAYQNRKYDIAVQLIRRAIAFRPNYTDAFSNLGNALKDNGQLDEAVAAFRRAVALDPKLPEAHNNLGIALRDKGQPDEAIASFSEAIRLRPGYPKAYSNLGVALQDKGLLDNAIAAYRQAILYKADYVEAHANLGNALKLNGQLDESITACRHAIGLKADHPDAWNYLGIALSETGQLDDATTAFRKAIFYRPGFNQAHSNLLFALNYHPDVGSQTIAEEADQWSVQHAEPMRRYIVPHSNNRAADRRLRIGYVSSDLNGHPVGRFLLPLLAEHDRSQFEIFAYAQVRGTDETTQQLASNTDCWRNIVGMSDVQVADLIRQDRIDILVDLAGHTARHRLLVFACKPAPVQISYLGYPATTGLKTIDYRLTDAFADPIGMTEAYCTEQLIRLPGTAWCYQALPISGVHPRVGSRATITFGSFNNFTKVNEPLLKCWAQILHGVKNSRLMLKAVTLKSQSARQTVLRAMVDAGISTDRISLFGSLPLAEHLALYNQMDIALDTYPYHGTTTTCEALWMGVPVVTRAGNSHVSRVGVSLLSNLGLQELIGSDREDYIQIAIDLANNRPRLAELSGSLRLRMIGSPLMDAPRFARKVESAYRRMWKQWCSLTPSDV